MTTNFAKREDSASAVAIEADRKMVVVGAASLTAHDGCFALARYNLNGTDAAGQTRLQTADSDRSRSNT